MPVKSKKQWKKLFALENEGKLPKGKAKQWARETKTPYKNLPNKKEACLRMAADLGRIRAMDAAGFTPDRQKTAGILSGLGSVAAPAAIGFTMAPEGREREGAGYGALAGILGGAMGSAAMKGIAPKAGALGRLLGSAGAGVLAALALRHKADAVKDLTADLKTTAQKIDTLPPNYLLNRVRSVSPRYQAKIMAGLRPPMMGA
jgi:hypothetical protein